jgi:competence protein ComGF
MDIRQSKGSTLLETLLAFSCFIVIISLLPTLVSAIHVPKHVSGTGWLKPMEIHLFFEQMALEIRQSNDLSLSWGRLMLTKDNGNLVQIERYGTYVRRRVNYKGHDVMLTNVKTIIFQLVENGVQITVTGRNGKQYSKRISLTPYRNEAA